MTAAELRRRFIDFFVKKQNHVEISSASLLPENDPTVLFTTAGMQPLSPYLLGEKHPLGKRLTNAQKCLRTDDIEEVGDETHLTFFEMLGNWSLGDYGKEEAIKMSYEFLISELKIPLNRLAFSVFAGDKDAPFDKEAFEIWKSFGVPEERLAKLGKKDNWWGPAGQTGPCGPDTEMFYFFGKEEAPEKFDPQDDRWVEIWNNVFMEYEKKADGSFVTLTQKNVDTGLGLERMSAILEDQKNIFETSLFSPIINKLKEISLEKNETARRIIADHIRAATFVIGDDQGVTPSNLEAGYIVRKLIRRAIRHGKKLGIHSVFTPQVAEIIIQNYREAYPELDQNKEKIYSALREEEEKFSETLASGEKEIIKTLNRAEKIEGRKAFLFYQSYGFPLEMTEEILTEQGINFGEKERKDFEQALQEHQNLARQGAAAKFTGGLADHSEKSSALHTATHLLHAALRQTLGNCVEQRGSNITKERLRFDFNYHEKLTSEQKKEVEKIVNEAIAKKIPVVSEEIPIDEAKKRGAVGIFTSKYGEQVKIYTIDGYSCEMCGGPHAKNTAELGKFKIKKEESSSKGVRRIKAVLDKN